MLKRNEICIRLSLLNTDYAKKTKIYTYLCIKLHIYIERESELDKMLNSITDDSYVEKILRSSSFC